MAKAIVCVGQTQVESGQASVSFTVSLLGPPNLSYGSSYTVDTGLSVANNLLAWRNKIIAQAAERGITLAPSDVIVFGAPS